MDEQRCSRNDKKIKQEKRITLGEIEEFLDRMRRKEQENMTMFEQDIETKRYISNLRKIVAGELYFTHQKVKILNALTKLYDASVHKEAGIDTEAVCVACGESSSSVKMILEEFAKEGRLVKHSTKNTQSWVPI
jgi:hypothetical protein